ncbi:hypothetical protein DUI87_24426 [Hirundo rustica rustica]|uniref:Uncharacterized protein n=1 Tax=Hirundo rustica rustica TaxID=333673 RepID=A0A3M0JD52_HIRRU|nr:hypothetical protein DUI87_24426 [Hirundo rustica rustica]
MLLLHSQWVYVDDMEQAEASPSTAPVLGTGHGTLFLVFWQGKIQHQSLAEEEFWSQTCFTPYRHNPPITLQGCFLDGAWFLLFGLGFGTGVVGVIIVGDDDCEVRNGASDSSRAVSSEEL